MVELLLIAVQALAWVGAFFACGCMIYFAYRFFATKTELGDALAHDHAFQAVNLFITGVFAYSSFVNLYNIMPPWLALALRLIIIGGALWSSYRIYKVMHRSHGRSDN